MNYDTIEFYPQMYTKSHKYKICIICEGNEECMYLERLSNLRVWNDVYDIYLANAGGNGNIPARYQDKYQNGDFDAIFVFCDTEKKNARAI